ncbi:MAG: class I SAM-dependent methyltransferase [Chitinophagaceae bacterium]|nr:class I SAM-dependent methyltransferase [Chitinophagaceae bacterium]
MSTPTPSLSTTARQVLADIAAKVSPYSQQPVDQAFVEHVSNVYHGMEAAHYDEYESSIADAEEAWQKALHFLAQRLPQRIRVLDYGAGTGFASLQMLQSAIGPRIAELVCFDLSPAMIEMCREKMKAFPQVRFTFYADVAGREALRQEAPFHIVATNAVLHHMYDVNDFLKQLPAMVHPDGVYIAGHEPNRPFYYNAVLLKATRQFQVYKRLRRRLSPGFWLQKLGAKAVTPSFIQRTIDALLADGSLARPLPHFYVQKMIDVHVPWGLGLDQPWGQIGFSSSETATQLGEDWKAVFTASYSHIKDAEATHHWWWKHRISKLADRYPADGADALVVFGR